MTTTLSDMQFEILPDLTSDEGLVFGIGADVSIDDGGFLPGDDDWNIDDASNPRRGGTSFGRETLNGPSWGWNLHVNRTELAEALETLGTFKTAWRALHLRDSPGAVLPIRYQLDGRVRRVYGRPRRFAAPPSNLILSGYIPITVDFQTVDGFVYDDVESAVTLSMQQGSFGGFTFPTVLPVETLPVGLSQQQVVVSGDAPAYPVVRFNGPVTNPILEHGDWTLSLDLTIPDGQYVEVDLRPWALTALLNGTSSVAGKIGRRQYLADMVMQPGPNTLLFRGSASESTATCAVRWSNAWNSI